MKASKGKLAKVAALAALALVLLSIVPLVWWIHSPYFALQQIGSSISKHDAETFYRYCDAKTLVTTFTNELFLEPAMATKGMSQFQCIVAGGAIVITKAKMDNALLSSIDRMVSPIPHTSFYHVFPEQLYSCNNVYNDSSSFYSLKLVSRTLDLSDFARNLGHELKNEQADLKRLAAQRMQEYAASHQDKLIGRLIAGPGGKVQFKSLLAEYGFQLDNVKAMYIHNEDDRQIATIEFFSPKVNANVPLSLELTPAAPSEVLSQYRVIRIWKLKETLQKLGEDTDTQVQDLIRCSLQDIAPEQAQDRTSNLLKRLGRHESTKKLLQQLKGKF